MSALFPSDIDRLEAKLDKHGDALTQISVTLAAQHVTLQEHIRRTELLEHEITPLKESHALWRAVLKVMAVLHVSGASIFAAMKWVFHKI